MIAAYPDFSVQEREDNSMRPDGTRVKGLSAVVQALPYVMPKRYDAQNMTTETADEDIIRKYIREKRREGRTVTHMSLLIAAYYRAYLQHPKINYFIMNSKIYERNHFCVSFVMLKTRADGTPDETVLKIFLEPADDVFSITEKIRAAIDCNARREHDNATDRFVTVAFSVPGLAWLIFRGAYLMDRLGILPRKIIDLSPFHTSLFITNLASIRPGPSTTTATSSAPPASSSAWASPRWPLAGSPASGRRPCPWALSWMSASAPGWSTPVSP